MLNYLIFLILTLFSTLNQPFIFLGVLAHFTLLPNLLSRETLYTLKEVIEIKDNFYLPKKKNHNIYISFSYIIMGNELQILSCSRFHVLLLSPCQDIVHHVEEP